MANIQFKGKAFVQNHHLQVPYHELIPQPKKSLSKKTSLHDNLIIHGDNLKALKALLPLYAGKIKCIYIDPPYNTGKENWRYNDNVNGPMMQEWLGKVVDKEDLTRHDKWLCMMSPRLKLLKEMLTQDGVILISIDDNEIASLKQLMDEIFFEENFVAQLVWEKGRKNDAKLFSVGHEYVLVYARSRDFLRATNTIWREPKPGAMEVWEKYCELKAVHKDDTENIEQALVGWFKEIPKKSTAKALSRYHRVDQWGPWRDRDISWPGGDGPRYDVIHPVTGKPCKVPDAGWRYSTSEAMQQQIESGLVVFRKDHTEPPFRKAHLRPIPEELDDEDSYEDDSAEELIGMQVMPSVIYKQSQVTAKYFRQIMGKTKFENPKDHEVIARLLQYVTSGDKNCTILDSFAGSGTTAHAVLSLNKSDKGNRRFVLIECENYVDNVTAERVRRVINGIPRAKDEALQAGLGGSYSYFTLGDPIELHSILSGDKLPSYADLARYVFYTATGEEFDSKKVDRKRHYIGSSREYDVYLLYEPTVDKLKNLALTMDVAKSLGKPKDRRRLVFAPTKYLDQTHLDHYRIDFAQLPFEIYELAQ